MTEQSSLQQAGKGGGKLNRRKRMRLWLYALLVALSLLFVMGTVFTTRLHVNNLNQFFQEPRGIGNDILKRGTAIRHPRTIHNTSTIPRTNHYDSNRKKTQPLEAFKTPVVTNITEVTNRMSGIHHNQSKGLSQIKRRRFHEPCARTNIFDFPEGDGCTFSGSNRPHCQFQNVRVDLSKIVSDQMGGEPLAAVMGQKEEAEYLTFRKGAFTVPSPALSLVPTRREERFFYLNDVFASIQAHKDNGGETKAASSCQATWRGTTLFLQRYEYVNMFHTTTDWWNTFHSIPIKQEKGVSAQDSDIELLDLPINLVFLDAHPQGNLDVVWPQLLGGNITHVRLLGGPKDTICFDKVRFVPAGYTSPLISEPFGAACPHLGQANDFMNWFLASFNLQNVQSIPGRIVVIDRIPYVSHPRSNGKKAERTLSNLNELAQSLPAQFEDKLSNNFSMSVEVVALEGMPMREQIKSIRQAEILIANHGAGMTHLLFVDKGSLVLEMSCDLEFFKWLAKWKPIHHGCHSRVFSTIPKYYWETKIVRSIENMYRSPA